MNNVFYLPNIARLCEHEVDTRKTAGSFVLVVLAVRYVHQGCLLLQVVVFGLPSMGFNKKSYWNSKWAQVFKTLVSSIPFHVMLNEQL